MKCTHGNCKSKTEIEDYLKNFQVDTWAIYDKIDFKNYDQQPSYKVMTIFTSEILGATIQTKTLNTQVMSMSRHKFEMEDDIIHFG